jgi:hypothetical protein
MDDMEEWEKEYYILVVLSIPYFYTNPIRFATGAALRTASRHKNAGHVSSVTGRAMTKQCLSRC